MFKLLWFGVESHTNPSDIKPIIVVRRNVHTRTKHTHTHTHNRVCVCMFCVLNYRSHEIHCTKILFDSVASFQVSG